MKSNFVYVSYIKTTPERLWEALTTPNLMKLYWIGMDTETDWKLGSAWTMKFPDGSVADTGEIVEFSQKQRIAIKWRNEWKPELKNEGFSLCTFELEPADGVIKLTVKHEMDVPNSKFIESVSGAWPICISNLKSLLELGDVIFVYNPRHA
jgi:uncharacterized protein YndB with AHSA1/START domain